MNIRRIVPNLQTAHLAESRDFYAELLGMQVGMDLGWIVNLSAVGAPTAQLQILSQDATAPVVPDISIEVDDVDEVHHRAVQRGAIVVYPLTDEPWGVRRFFVQDPGGAVVNIVTHRAG